MVFISNFWFIQIFSVIKTMQCFIWLDSDWMLVFIQNLEESLSQTSMLSFKKLVIIEFGICHWMVVFTGFSNNWCKSEIYGTGVVRGPHGAQAFHTHTHTWYSPSKTSRASDFWKWIELLNEKFFLNCKWHTCGLRAWLNSNNVSIHTGEEVVAWSGVDVSTIVHLNTFENCLHYVPLNPPFVSVVRASKGWGTRSCNTSNTGNNLCLI